MFLTPGWHEFKRQTEARIDAAMIQLADITRPASPSDDALRGLISGLRWALSSEMRTTRELVSIQEDRLRESEPEPAAVGSPMVAETEAPTE